MSNKPIRERQAVEKTPPAPHLNPALEMSEPSQTIGSGLLRSILDDQGLGAELLKALAPGILRRGGARSSSAEILSAALADVFSVDPRLPGTCKAVAFVGATGVGKTTTIAKIAARMRMAFEINIGLVSADCYRVGAGFQLQSYAALIRLPYRALDPRFSLSAQLSTALEELSEMDLILIDTAGFSPRNPNHISQLSSDLAAFPDVERVLVLPAPCNSRDLFCTVKEFNKVGYQRVVISKLDESGYMGPVLSAVHNAGRPIAFLTTGQRVPEDIEPASLKRLAWMLKRTLH